ncbi:hypothetical protein HZC32_02035 [Candidatus Woesearchaeota archaeon]|nr:hypothetical protein [Candidatus Woesearchaeota archaeon]
MGFKLGEGAEENSPTSLEDHLKGVILEVEFTRGKDGAYSKISPLLDGQGIANLPLNVEQVKDKLIVTANEIRVKSFSINKAEFGNPDKIFMQYKLTDDGISVLSISDTCVASQATVSIRVAPPQNIPIVPPTGPTDIIPEKADDALKTRPPEQNGNILKLNPCFYLAQAIERRIIAEKLYDNGMIRFSEEIRYEPDLGIPAVKIFSITGHKMSAVLQWKSNRSPLLRDFNKRGISAADILCVRLCDYSIEKSYGASQVAKFFGVDEEIILGLIKRGYLGTIKADDTRIKAIDARRRFRESYDLVIEAMRKGESLLNRTVTEEVIKCEFEHLYDPLLPEETRIADFVKGYQSKFDSRFLEHLVKERRINNGELVLGSTPIAYNSEISSVELIRILAESKRVSEEEIANTLLSRKLIEPAQERVSPFAGLVLYTAPLEQKSERVLLEDIASSLHITPGVESKDLVLFQYLESSELGFRDGADLAMKYETYAKIYQNLTNHFIGAMCNNQRREALMGS